MFSFLAPDAMYENGERKAILGARGVLCSGSVKNLSHFFSGSPRNSIPLLFPRRADHPVKTVPSDNFFSSPMSRYFFVPHFVPAMCLSLTATAATNSPAL